MRRPRIGTLFRWMCYYLLGAATSVGVAWRLGNTAGGSEAEAYATEQFAGCWWMLIGVESWCTSRVHYTAYQTREQCEFVTEGMRNLSQKRGIPVNSDAFELTGWKAKAFRTVAERLHVRVDRFSESISGVGWPAQCVALRLVDKHVRESPSPFLTAIPLRGREAEYMPLWSGLAVNGLCYAPIIWGFHIGVRGTLRLNRRLRGNCPNCGYCKRGLHVQSRCPECGM